MKKIILLSLLLMLISMSMVLGVTELPQNSSSSISANSLDGVIAYNHETDKYYLSTVNFPNGYIQEYNSSFSLTNTYNVNVYYNQLTVTQDNFFVIKFNSAPSTSDELCKLNNTGGLLSCVTVSFEDDVVSITDDDNYIYVMGQNEAQVYIYDYSLNYVRTQSMGISLPAIPSNFHNLAYDNDNELFYFYDGNTEILNILDSSFNYISQNEYYINKTLYFPNSGFRDMDVVNGLIAGATFGTPKAIKLFSLPPPPAQPNYYFIGGLKYSKNYCINENYYCENVSYVLNSASEPQFYCSDYNDTSFCSGGCETVYSEDDNLYYGVCSQLACENECQIEDFTTCNTQTTYTRCGNYDADACLEYSNELFCPSNQYCSDTSIGSQCSSVNVSFTDTYTQDKLVVKTSFETATVEPIKEETVEFDKTIFDSVLIATNPLLYTGYKIVDTVFFSVKEEGVELQTTTKTDVLNALDFTPQLYSAFTCQYEEEYVVTDDLRHNILSDNNWTTDYVIEETDNIFFVNVNTSTTLNKTLYETTDNLVIETIVKPENTGNHTINFYSNEGVLNEILIVYNETSKQTLIYESTYNKLLVNSTSLQPTDDLEFIYVEATFNNEINTIFYELQLGRKPQTTTVNTYYYSLPTPYNNTYTNQPVLLSYGSTSSFLVYQVAEKTISDLPPYTYTTSEQDYLQNCDFDTVGCFTIKTFGNNDAVPTYHFSDEIGVCVDELGTLVSEEAVISVDDRTELEKLIGKTLTSREKLGISLAIIIFIFIAGLSYKDGENDSLVFTVTGILCGLSLVILSVLNFIPVWITGLSIIIGAVVLAKVMKNSIAG